MGSMLEAIELSKTYNGTVALNALNLNIQQGEIFSLLGANGAGKIEPSEFRDYLLTIPWKTSSTFVSVIGDSKVWE